MDLNLIVTKHKNDFEFSKENDFIDNDCFKHLSFGISVFKKDNSFNSTKKISDLDYNSLDEALENLEINEDEYGILYHLLKINHPAFDEEGEYVELYYLHKSNKKIEDEIDYLIYKYHKSGDKNILKSLKNKIKYLDIE